MKIVTTQLRLPADLHAGLREIAEHEERSFNAQIVQLLRQGVQQYQPAHQPIYTMKPILDGWRMWKNATRRDLAIYLRVNEEALSRLESFPVRPDWAGSWGGTEEVRQVGTWNEDKIRALAVLFGADPDRLAEVVAAQPAVAEARPKADDVK